MNVWSVVIANDAVMEIDVMKVDFHSVVVIARTFEKYAENRDDGNGLINRTSR